MASFSPGGSSNLQLHVLARAWPESSPSTGGPGTPISGEPPRTHSISLLLVATSAVPVTCRSAFYRTPKQHTCSLSVTHIMQATP